MDIITATTVTAAIVLYFGMDAAFMQNRVLLSFLRTLETYFKAVKLIAIIGNAWLLIGIH